MLHPDRLSGYAFTFDNWGANPSSTPGTSVTPGASNAEGAWTQIASAANIAQDCYWLYILVLGGATSTAAKNHLLDIGVDPAGGTNYTPIISNIVCGASMALASGGGAGPKFLFPYLIRAGSSVAVRVQGSNATAGTVRVVAKFWGQPTRPENAPIGMYSQTFGTITNSNGASFTPGNVANGAWVSLGIAINPLWWFQLGVQIDNGTMSAHSTYVDIAVGDATNKLILARTLMNASTTETLGFWTDGNLMGLTNYFPVPAGAELWIRGRNSAAPVAGYNATVIGIGG